MSPEQMAAHLRGVLGPRQLRFDEITARMGEDDRALCARTLRTLRRAGVIARNWDRRWTSVEYDKQAMAKLNKVAAERLAAIREFADQNHLAVFAHLLSRDDFQERLRRRVRDVLGRDLTAGEVLRFAAFVNQNRGGTQ